MNKIIALVKGAANKVIAKVKSEPAVSTGGLFGVAIAVEQWVQVNHITNARTGASLALPIVVSFVIRAFVTPSAKVDSIVASEVAKVQAAINPPAA